MFLTLYILLAFMEHGISSLRDIEKLCWNDIRFLYLLDGMKAPSFATVGNFIRMEANANRYTGCSLWDFFTTPFCASLLRPFLCYNQKYTYDR